MDLFNALAEYNTRVVLLGVSLLGVASGVVGAFMLLRKRSLLGDAVSHATLPGICLAYMAMVMAGGSGKYLPGLLLGALLSGLLGMLTVMLLRSVTRLREDAALGVVLSVFFGLGVALLRMSQKMKTGSAAGLESFIYGKTASMLASDAWLIGTVALVVVIGSIVLFKEFTLLCFDQGYAASQGWPVTVLDLILMTMVVIVTVIGLQAVGLILVIALLIIPAAAARFWTERLSVMVLISGMIGACSGAVGAMVSATIPKMPAGALIVLVAAGFFVVSVLLGAKRGLLVRWVGHRRLSRKIGREHVLRALFELAEAAGGARMGVDEQALMVVRSWNRRRLRRLLRDAEHNGYVACRSGLWYLTKDGKSEANRVVRNHRLWEMYLMTHADVAAARVDQGADRIEHVLGTALVDQLEQLLQVDGLHNPLPHSPHPIHKPHGDVSV